MDIEAFADPVKIGPGIWFLMHLEAVRATTTSLKQAFIINVNNLCDNFKCKRCQSHFKKFINSHPLENYWNVRREDGTEMGFFKWTWELHNQVNKRLKKYEPRLEEAYNLYNNFRHTPCFNCGVEPEQRTLAIPPILTFYMESNKILNPPLLAKRGF